MPREPRPSIPPAAVLGCLSLLVIGWANLLVPSLIRSIEADFGQTDAGLGVLFLIQSVSYAAASLLGGLLTERIGRRVVLSLAALVLVAGLLGLAVTSSWTVVLAVAIPFGAGAGAIDGGSNGLFLDLFPTSRGRALNTLHLFFGIGAFAAPLVAGQLVVAGVSWRVVVAGTALAIVPLAALLAIVPMPSGHHLRERAPATGPADDATAAAPTSDPPTVPATPRSTTLPRLPRRIAWPLIALAIAIAAYVGAEVGVSSWLVRFLDSATVSTATATLSLFWGALALGRLVSARWSDRFDHARFASTASILAAVALVAAVVAPSLAVSIVLFGAVGFAFGPIFPLIMAVAGDRYPARAAAVSGALAGFAVVGAVAYPPLMGFMSVDVGLGVAMVGAAALVLVCGIVLGVVGRYPADDPDGLAATVLGTAIRAETAR